VIAYRSWEVNLWNGYVWGCCFTNWIPAACTTLSDFTAILSAVLFEHGRLPPAPASRAAEMRDDCQHYFNFGKKAGFPKICEQDDVHEPAISPPSIRDRRLLFGCLDQGGQTNEIPALW